MYGRTLMCLLVNVLCVLQDCQGGCFDSAAGAAGKVSTVDDQEYGPQDFFGYIEEMRVWKVVRTPEQIRQGMIADDGRGAGGGFDKPGIDKDDPSEYSNRGRAICICSGGGEWIPLNQTAGSSLDCSKAARLVLGCGSKGVLIGSCNH